MLHKFLAEEVFVFISIVCDFNYFASGNKLFAAAKSVCLVCLGWKCSLALAERAFVA